MMGEAAGALVGGRVASFAGSWKLTRVNRERSRLWWCMIRVREGKNGKRSGGGLVHSEKGKRGKVE